MKKIGVLLTNTGTPDAPTPIAVRRYLKEFLTDNRIIRLPRIVWLPILYGLILSIRPYSSAKLYKKIWTEDGSPLRFYMQQLPALLQEALAKKNATQFEVEIGMNYGNPNIQQALANLRDKNIDEFLVFPLYPQYSDVTTASSIDRAKKYLHQWQTPPTLKTIKDYAEHPDYIRAVVASIQNKWLNDGEPEHLLISFHGIPERFIENGDPYYTRCVRSAELIANALKLTASQWTLCFQSRFGYSKWLNPSTQTLFTELPQQGIKKIDVVCPGFSVDCLETLEEIAIRGEETFFAAGGEVLRYIPGLNANDAHIELLSNLIIQHTD